MTASSGDFKLSPEQSRHLIRRAQSVIAEILLEVTALQSMPLTGSWFASVGRDLAAETGRLRAAYLQNLLQLVDTCHRFLVYLEKATMELEQVDGARAAGLRSTRQQTLDRVLETPPSAPLPSPSTSTTYTA